MEYARETPKPVKITIEQDGKVIQVIEAFAVMMIGETAFACGKTWRYLHNIGWGLAMHWSERLESMILQDAAENLGLMAEEPTYGQLTDHIRFVLQGKRHDLIRAERRTMAKLLDVDLAPCGCGDYHNIGAGRCNPIIGISADDLIKDIEEHLRRQREKTDGKSGEDSS